MRSKPLIAFAVVVLVGIALVLVTAVTKRDAAAQTLGDDAIGPIALLKKGQEVCQKPIGLADDVERVEFNPGTPAHHPPAIDVTIRTYHGNRVLGRGLLPAGYDVAKPQTVSVGHVASGQLTELCFRNRGPARVAIYGDLLWGALCTPTAGHLLGAVCVPGSVRPTLSTSAPYMKGKELPGDLAAIFLHNRSSSLFARLPKMLDRASLFRPAFVTPALWWVLIALWLLFVPAMLGFAVWRISRGDDDGAPRASGPAAVLPPPRPAAADGLD
jgi:hypothetical protein